MIRLAYLFGGQAYEEAFSLLDSLPMPQSLAQRSERRRLRGWLLLARGETERAYDLFWSCADNAGGRAGILVLTVLAGQVTAAMAHWQRHCATLPGPPLELPDAPWHARPVALAAIAQLEGYPFEARSLSRGAAGLYTALLYRAIGEAPSAFIALSQVAGFFPLADLVRDRWLDQVVCLPAPASSPPTGALSLPTPSGLNGTASPRREFSSSELVIQSAARLLLYPDVPTLEKQCDEALSQSRWMDAMEILRRLLFLDPEHAPSLEKRWRLHLRLESREAAKSDLYALVDLYERSSKSGLAQTLAATMVDLFPDDERALLKMCFLQSRLNAPLQLARYGRQLLELCSRHGLGDRASSYRLWLLRQNLSLDDRGDFQARR